MTTRSESGPRPPEAPRARPPASPVVRYAVAAASAAAGMGLRAALEAWVGPGLPTYITFYPAVMVAALVAGPGPGAVATALSALTAAYWILPPSGYAEISSNADRLGLVVFCATGALVTVVAELYRRSRDKAAAYDRQAAAREGLARLAAFAEATFEGIVESEAGRIVDCNDQAARIFGYTVDELKGREIADLVAPEDRGRVMAAIRSGVEATTEHGIVRKDGTRLVAETHGRPVPDSPRRLTAIRDVTQHKKVEQALRENEARFRDIANASAEWIWEVDAGFAYTFASGKVEEVLGYAPGEILGRSPFDLMPPEEEARVRQQFQAIAERRVPFRDLANVNLHKSGKLRHVLTSGVPVFDDRGDLVGYRGVDRDVTERKWAEAQLLASEAQFRLLFEANPNPMMVFDEETLRYLAVNDAALRQYGYGRAEFLALTVLDVRPPEELEATLASIRLHQGARGAREGVLQHVRKGGWRFSAEVFVSSIEFDGRPGRLVMALDVTERQRFEQELRAAREAADLANRAKSDFLAQMSHEIRTPLNGMLGMTELALLEGVPDKVREYLTLSKQSARTLLELVNDVLDLAKIEAGRVELRSAPFDVRDAVDSVVTTFQSGASERELLLTLAVAPDVPSRVAGDEGRLRQVLTNLLGNALKFTERGEIAVGVAVDRAGEADGAGPVRLAFTVRDTGIGIPAGQLASIFESFTQVKHSSHARYGGTGLGLSIARQLVELMGGALRVESEPGRGSVF
ncbi:MAG: PAS domain S-box protein, partial [Deltaproteobacteria bacterium]|nr:PAS domain S-box protein [Deltaproteobacteria bacterium]